MQQKRAEAMLKYLSNDVYNIYLDQIVSEILTTNRHLLKLIIHGKGPCHKQKQIDIYVYIYPALYILPQMDNK